MSSSIRRATFVLMMLVPLGQMAIDIYTPSLPHIANSFQVSAAVIQTTVSMFMMLLGFSQFLGGFLINVLNKRSLFIISTLFYIFGSIICACSASVSWLYVGRLIQGMAGGISTVLVNNYLIEFYSGHRFNVMISRTSVLFSMAPILMPYIGGILQHYLGWRSTFAALSLYALFLLIMGFIFLPTSPCEKQDKVLSKLIKDLKIVMSDIKFIAIIDMLVMCYAYQILFVSVIPFILQNQFQYTPYQYGVVALLFGVAYFCGSTLNTFLLKYFSKSQLLTTSVMASVGITVAQFFGQWLNVDIYLFLISTQFFATGPIFPNGMSTAFERHKERMGAVSSLFGILILAGVFLANFIATSFFHINSLFAFSVTYLIFTCFLFAGWWVYKKYD